MTTFPEFVPKRPRTARRPCGTCGLTFTAYPDHDDGSRYDWTCGECLDQEHEEHIARMAAIAQARGATL